MPSVECEGDDTFDENLVKVMSPDSKVSVSVGQRGSLDFTPSTSESGYFAYEEGSNTISAVFTGVVDGDEVTESKSYSNVKAGIITASLLNFIP